MLAGEVRHQHRNIVGAFAQRRHDDRNHVQAIEEIFLKLSRVHELTQVAVGGRDHAHVHALGAFRAERFDFALLQDAQELGLQADAHRANFVEEDRAAVGQRELAFLRGGRIRERALDVAEELRFEQGLGNRRAVDLDERQASLRAAIVDGAGDQFLARAGFARDQYRASGRRHQLDATDHLGHGVALTDDAVPIEVLADRR